MPANSAVLQDRALGKISHAARGVLKGFTEREEQQCRWALFSRPGGTDKVGHDHPALKRRTFISGPFGTKPAAFTIDLLI